MSDNPLHIPSKRSAKFTKVAGLTAVTCSLAMFGSIAGLGVANAATSPVGLGTAESYSVLAGSTVTNVGATTLQGDLGVNPGTAITGFPPGIVGGTIHAADAPALQAQNDLTTAYNDVAGRPSTAAIAGDLGGLTLVDGVYTSASSLDLTGTLTLDGQGDPSSVFVFQVGSALTTASASNINLINGANACNIYWQVGSSATLGTASDFKGNLLALTSVSLTTGATVEGRVLARNGQVSMDTNVFTNPVCATVPTPSASASASASPSASPSASVSPSASPSATDTATLTPVAPGGPGNPGGFVPVPGVTPGTSGGGDTGTPTDGATISITTGAEETDAPVAGSGPGESTGTVDKLADTGAELALLPTALGLLIAGIVLMLTPKLRRIRVRAKH